MGEQTRVQSSKLRLEDVPPELAARLTTAIVSDSLDAAGVRGKVMSARIGPLDPGMRSVGRAHTVQFAPTESDSDDPYAAAMDFIDRIAAGDLPIIATGGGRAHGLLG